MSFETTTYMLRGIGTNVTAEMFLDFRNGIVLRIAVEKTTFLK